MSLEHEFHGPNLGYILELYQKYRNDPSSVDEGTRKLFETWAPSESESAALPTRNLLALTAAANLAQAIRSYGYLSADLNPLEREAVDNQLLTLEFHGLHEDDLFELPADLLNLPEEQSTGNAQEAIEKLRSIYCSKIGYDYGH